MTAPETAALVERLRALIECVRLERNDTDGAWLGDRPGQHLKDAIAAAAASLLSQPEPQGTASERDMKTAARFVEHRYANDDDRCRWYTFNGGCDCDYAARVAAISSALAGERERCAAKITPPEVVSCTCDKCAVRRECAAAIRAGERQGE